MAQTIELLVKTRVVDNDLRKSVKDVNREFQQAGQRAGTDFSKNFATGVEQGTNRVRRSVDQVTNSTTRLRDAQEKLNSAYRSGDIEKVISATRRLTTVHKNALTETTRLQREQSKLATVLTPNFAAMSNAASGVSAQFASMGQHLGNLTKAAGPAAIGALTIGIGALAGVAAQASQSLLLIPGAVAGVGAAVGTLAIGFNNFGDAVSNLRDSEAFGEALAKLAPSAAAAANELRSLLPVWDELARSTQQSLFAGIAPQLEQLATTWMGPLQTMTSGIASGFNQMFSGVFAQLQNPATMATIQNTMNSLVEAFQQLAPAAAPFTDAMAVLIDVGASALPAIASGAASAAQEFANFLRSAQQSGQLQEFLSKGLEALQQLGPMAMDAARAFLALTPIGERILPMIAAALEGIADWCETIAPIAAAVSPAFTAWEFAITGVTTAVNVLQFAFGGITSVVQGVSNAVTPLLQTIGAAIDAVLGPLDEMLGMAKMIPGVAAVLGTVEGVVGAHERINGRSPGAAPGVPGLPPPNLSARPGTPEWEALSPADRWAAADAARGGPTQGPLTGTYRRRDGSTGYVSPGSIGPSSLPNAAPTRTGGGGSSYGSSGQKSADGLVPNAERLRALIYEMFPEVQEIGGYRPPDGYNEHSSGEALDIMVGSNRELGDKINKWLLANADALGIQYNLWRQAEWQPDGDVRPMADRGSPTQNHMDHVHARVQSGALASGNVMPVGAQPYQLGNDYGTRYGTQHLQQVEVTNFTGGAASQLQGIGAGLDDDLGASRGLAGLADNLVRFLAKLATAPLMGPLSVMAQNSGGGFGAVGMLAAQNTPLSGISAPTPGSPYASALGGPSPVPGLLGTPIGTPASGIGLGPAPGPAPSSVAYGGQMQGVPGASGGGMNGTGMGQMLASAAPALDAMFPGAGQAAQTGIQLADRTIGYMGQLAGIGVQGLLETFTLGGSSELSDPMRTLPGRIVAGLAGGKPALPNTAGKANGGQPQGGKDVAGSKTNGGKAEGGPLLNIQTMNVGSAKDGKQVSDAASRQFKTNSHLGYFTRG